MENSTVVSLRFNGLAATAKTITIVPLDATYHSCRIEQLSIQGTASIAEPLQSHALVSIADISGEVYSASNKFSNNMRTEFNFMAMTNHAAPICSYVPPAAICTMTITSPVAFLATARVRHIP